MIIKTNDERNHALNHSLDSFAAIVRRGARSVARPLCVEYGQFAWPPFTTSAKAPRITALSIVYIRLFFTEKFFSLMLATDLLTWMLA